MHIFYIPQFQRHNLILALYISLQYSFSFVINEDKVLSASFSFSLRKEENDSNGALFQVIFMVIS